MATYGRARSTRLLVVGLLVASLVTITVDARGGDRGPLALVGRAVGAVIGPLQEGVAAVFRPIGSFVTNVFRAGSLAERVRRLEEENAQLRAESTEVATLRAQNAEYESMLEIGEELQLDLMGATVRGESQSNFEWAVFIDKGATDGVAEDMPVIAAEGLVGRVVDVYPTSAKVMLIIDPDSRVSARLVTSRERGLLVGQREELLRFALIDAETEILPGELIETSGYKLDVGYEGLFPPGIQVGQVERVEPSDDGINVDVLVRPNVDFSRLDRVSLVVGEEPLQTAPLPEEERPDPGE